jgi:hypothetical protein
MRVAKPAPSGPHDCLKDPTPQGVFAWNSVIAAKRNARFTHFDDRMTCGRTKTVQISDPALVLAIALKSVHLSGVQGLGVVPARSSRRLES